ncbi:MAG: hypothetical protein ACRYGR_02865 [Janthinobacterium lividum]
MSNISSRPDTLNNVLQITSKSLEASQQRVRNAAENMANSKSANFVPKSLEFQSKFDKAAGVHMVELKKVHEHHDQMQQIYDPTHPQADEDGMVNLPKTDPLMYLMNLQEAKHEQERAIKAHEIATDMKQKIICMMSS